MGDSKRLVALFACLCLVVTLAAGCSVRPFSYATLWARSPGHRNMSLPDRVAKQYECDKRKLPFFEIEKHELIPKRVAAGSKLNHRLVYVLCPKNPTGVVRGTLRTRVLYEGKALLREVVDEKLRPGRWVLDSFITLPEGAAPGVYAMEVRFESRKGNLNAQIPFLIE